ncbi:uncharacterized protein LOC108674080 [Hyalella azteca]|uniref:Uncharacterized protein LOC108674080 n=1 Tax=Hyalella azteca TaxID=294128 RepID=A0A8B7NUR3_HYAAZ|nr:uncharacterized protein LOC108674080 [Hyalella azteca]XP_047737973.1 uncharacterized protein LOC108674080 [Hyalella azteca]XP_047737977.1 uncharacterized protein LOC108674080 [Hyalella azteca]
MALFISVIALLAPLSAAVDVPVVSLEGTAKNENYLLVGRQYKMTCSFRAGYDDHVSAVRWQLYGKNVYTWDAAAAGVTVTPPLLGHVSLKPEGPAPHNIEVTAPSLAMAGDYICSVQSTKGTVRSEAITIYVIDISNGKYETHVDLLSNMLQTTISFTTTTTTLAPIELTPSNSSTTTVIPPSPAPLPPAQSTVTTPPLKPLPFTSSSTKTPATPPPPWVPHGPASPPPECILVWWFRTPPIAPRPQIKCGFYDYTSNDVAEEMPGGLHMFQLPSGAWQAQIDSTRIPIASIPPNHRLGCIVTIPDTSYREVVKFEDGLTVDHEIDSVGCPSLDELSDLYGFILSIRGAVTNCRGDHVPESESQPAVATVKCPSAAIFKNGTLDTKWTLRLECVTGQTSWKIGTERSVKKDSPLAEEDMSDPMLAQMSDELIKRTDFDFRTYGWPFCIGGTQSLLLTKSISSLLLIFLPLLIWLVPSVLTS